MWPDGEKAQAITQVVGMEIACSYNTYSIAWCKQ